MPLWESGEAGHARAPRLRRARRQQARMQLRRDRATCQADAASRDNGLRTSLIDLVLMVDAESSPQPAAARNGHALRQAFRATARQVCASLRRVLPLVREGRGGDERPPRLRRGRVQRVRIKLQRRARMAASVGRDTIATLDDLSGLLADIAADVQARASMHATGIQADYAGRMAEAIRTAPRHQVAAILQGLRAELAQVLAAVAAAAQAETRARQHAAMAARSGGRPPSSSAPAAASDVDEEPGRPEAAAYAPRRGLGR